jgi:xylose isomerase
MLPEARVPVPTPADKFTFGLRRAFEDVDPDKAGERGCGFVRLSQLALEHLLGAR